MPVNIFEAIGAERHEVRHSRFLAFLLNPKREHGLKDKVLKYLLQETPALSCVELDALSLASAIVQCECKHIDILVRDHNNQIAIIIENKIDSAEHDDQLARYWESIARQYHDWRIIGLYLSPTGAPPSDERYLPISYDLICHVLDRVMSETPALPAEILSLIKQYTAVLHKHLIRPKSVEVRRPTANIPNPLMKHHGDTIALSSKHEQIDNLLEHLIVDADLTITWSNPAGLSTYIDFAYADSHTDGISEVNSLGFEISNSKDGVHIGLFIHRDADLSTRIALLEMAHHHSPPFMPSRGRTNTKKSQSIYRRTLLEKHELIGDLESIETSMTMRWKEFVETDLLLIKQVIAEYFATNVPTE